MPVAAILGVPTHIAAVGALVVIVVLGAGWYLLDRRK
jgi:uncharacterized membrane protein YphA (DoxX/SURF4 family)